MNTIDDGFSRHCSEAEPLVRTIGSNVVQERQHFDGRNDKLLTGYDVLVVENKIKKIGKNIKIGDTYEIDVKTGGFERGGRWKRS